MTKGEGDQEGGEGAGEVLAAPVVAVKGDEKEARRWARRRLSTYCILM